MFLPMYPLPAIKQMLYLELCMSYLIPSCASKVVAKGSLGGNIEAALTEHTGKASSKPWLNNLLLVWAKDFFNTLDSGPVPQGASHYAFFSSVPESVSELALPANDQPAPIAVVLCQQPARLSGFLPDVPGANHHYIWFSALPVSLSGLPVTGRLIWTPACNLPFRGDPLTPSVSLFLACAPTTSCNRLEFFTGKPREVFVGTMVSKKGLQFLYSDDGGLNYVLQMHQECSTIASQNNTFSAC